MTSRAAAPQAAAAKVRGAAVRAVRGASTRRANRSPRKAPISKTFCANGASGSLAAAVAAAHAPAARRPFQWPLIAGVLVVGWLVTGVYTVDEGEHGVITRLGDYNRSTGPGIHLHLPAPIEARQVINVTGQRTAEIGFSSRHVRTSSTTIPTKA